MNSSLFLINETHKTKTWWIFCSLFLFTFIPFFLIWLLCGEFNLLHLNWLIAKNTSMWHGMINNENIKPLADQYGYFYLNHSPNLLYLNLQNYLNKKMECNILNHFSCFNKILLIYIFSFILLSFFYPIILNLCKISGLDILPFSFSFAIFMTSLIITGLIPHYQKLMFIYWIMRIILSCLLSLIFFFLTNFFVNKYLANKPYSTDILFGYKTINEQNKEIFTSLNKNVDSFKKNDQTKMKKNN